MFAAVHHLDQLIICEPGRWDHHGFRAWVNAERRHWEQAAAGFARSIELGPKNVDIYYGAAVLRLRERDLPAYRATCEAAARRFGKARDAYTLGYLARTCSLAPLAVKDLDEPVRWARAAATDQPRNADLQSTLGAILYRAGRFEEAVRHLEEAVAIRGDRGNPIDRLFLAMAHARSGRQSTARKWLTKEISVPDRPRVPVPSASTGPFTLHWNSEIELAILRLEAEALIMAPNLPAGIDDSIFFPDEIKLLKENESRSLGRRGIPYMVLH